MGKYRRFSIFFSKIIDRNKRLDLCPFWRSPFATTPKCWSTAATTASWWLASRPLTVTATWSLRMSKKCGSSDQKASRVSFFLSFLPKNFEDFSSIYFDIWFFVSWLEWLFSSEKFYFLVKFDSRQTAARQSWSLHFQDVPPWWFGHHCPQKPTWGR